MVGRIFCLDAVGPRRPPLDLGERPQRRDTARAARLQAKREAAMAAFAKSWRGERLRLPYPARCARSSVTRRGTRLASADVTMIFQVEKSHFVT